MLRVLRRPGCQGSGATLQRQMEPLVGGLCAGTVRDPVSAHHVAVDRVVGYRDSLELAAQFADPLVWSTAAVTSCPTIRAEVAQFLAERRT